MVTTRHPIWAEWLGLALVALSLALTQFLAPRPGERTVIALRVNPLVGEPH